MSYDNYSSHWIDKKIVVVTPRDVHYGRGGVMNKNEREIHCIQNSCSDNNNNNNNSQ